MKSKKQPVVSCPNCLTRNNDKSYKTPMVVAEGNGYHCRFCDTPFTYSWEDLDNLKKGLKKK